jgi:hypothetical protein
MLSLVALGWTINVGMMVSAKINLQNAADAAAYAGASVQAQHLNQIGYLNYELRRNYKELLFKYYSVGNFGSFRFVNNIRTQPNPPPDGLHSFDYTNGPANANTDAPPIICIYDNPDNNYCKDSVVVGIKDYNADGTSIIDQAASHVTQIIIDAKVDDCMKMSRVNEITAYKWLYGDEHENIKSLNIDENDASKLLYSRTGEGSMGAIPKSVILSSKIRFLEDIINIGPTTMGVGGSQVSDFNDPGKREIIGHERSIKAYLSAKKNLSAYMQENLQMFEILPQARGKGHDKENEVEARNIKLSPQTISAHILAASFRAKLNDGTCEMLPSRFPITINIGYQKDPAYMTYYGVKLTTTVSPLMNPFGSPIRMTAYSAAKPFGSRIGPYIDPSELAPDISLSGTGTKYKWKGVLTIGADAAAGPTDVTDFTQIPNLPLTGPNDEIGWRNQKVLWHYWQLLSRGGDNAISVTLENLISAIQVSKAPDLVEKGRYLIPNPAPTLFNQPNAQLRDVAGAGTLSPASSSKFFQTPSLNNENVPDLLKEPVHRFYVPSNKNTVFELVQEQLKKVKEEMVNNPESFVGMTQAQQTEMFNQLIENIQYLWNDLKGKYEMHEVVTIENPFPKALAIPGTLPGGEFKWKAGHFVASEDGTINADTTNGPYGWLTSWNDTASRGMPPASSSSPPPDKVPSSAWGAAGHRREGYSVKFIPVRSIFVDEITPISSMQNGAPNYTAEPPSGAQVGELTGELFH